MALFKTVFHSGDDARDLWATVRDRLPSLRIEIESDVDGSALLPWELLRDPKTSAPLACDVAAFVRTHPRAARSPVLSVPAGDGRLRVLLVICRPGGRDDIPFRSSASQLVHHADLPHSAVDLDVLRPPTFAQLAEVLRNAARAGRPYQVVHFDGHGTWATLTPDVGVGVLSPVRPGAHGYLLFEDPRREDNQLLVDGPALGRLLAGTGVGVLVLEACRTAYADLPPPPGEGTQPDDAHGRVRAYGSLTQEIVDAGTGGVVAMLYSVYLDTSARTVATVYNELLAGRPLGEAVGAARRQLAADPHREVVFRSLPLQDWAVPVVYEAAPAPLVTRPAGEGASLRLTLDTGGGTAAAQADGGLPRPPDAGFYGRHETLLALDRAFDTHRTVLVHGYAGAGKTGPPGVPEVVPQELSRKSSTETASGTVRAWEPAITSPAADSTSATRVSPA